MLKRQTENRITTVIYHDPSDVAAVKEEAASNGTTVSGAPQIRLMNGLERGAKLCIFFRRGW